MRYAPQDGKWQVGEKATLLSDLRGRMTTEEYEQNKRALKEFLCEYFSSGDCRNSLGSLDPAMALEQLGSHERNTLFIQIPPWKRAIVKKQKSGRWQVCLHPVIIW